MENKMALAKETLNVQCKCVSKEQGKELCIAINKLSLAKNIVLMEGTLPIWLECLSEDLANYIFDYEDFLQAIKDCIRKPAYNRLDYADIYEIAKETSFKNRKYFVKHGLECPYCNRPAVYNQACYCVINDEKLLADFVAPVIKNPEEIKNPATRYKDLESPLLSGLNYKISTKRIKLSLEEIAEVYQEIEYRENLDARHSKLKQNEYFARESRKQFLQEAEARIRKQYFIDIALKYPWLEIHNQHIREKQERE